jgi:hypothetical protein
MNTVIRPTGLLAVCLERVSTRLQLVMMKLADNGDLGRPARADGDKGGAEALVRVDLRRRAP